MIRPVAFRLNEQTAVNNYYQTSVGSKSLDPQANALQEFDAFVGLLRQEGVEVTVFDDTISPSTPDSIFPNNWISFHQEGSIRLYPMYAENRRLERREDIVDYFQSNFLVNDIIRYTDWEKRGVFLEGTGSMIFDRQHKIAYAAISERTNTEALAKYSTESGFSIVSFHAYQSVGEERLLIYHTNVMMCLGDQFAVVCFDAIDAANDQLRLRDSLESTGKEIIEISEKQKESFAGNMLQIMGADDQKLIVMSTQAFDSLSPPQRQKLGKHGKVVHGNIKTIETLGGGSARCMMAEVFNPKLN